MKLSFEEIGLGSKNIVLLHGFLASRSNMKTIGLKLSKYYKVFLVDLRNHGASPHDTKMDYKTMTDDVLEFCDLNKIEKPILLGHSMGGKVAMVFATLFPNKVDTIIVEDIAPRKYENEYQDLLVSLDSLEITKLKNREEADKLLSKKIPNPILRSFLLKNLGLGRTKKKYFWKCNLNLFLKSINPILDFPNLAENAINIKSLFIQGSDSHYITSEDKQLILKKFPNSKLIEVDGAGHWIHYQKQQDFLKIVLNYLK